MDGFLKEHPPLKRGRPRVVSDWPEDALSVLPRLVALIRDMGPVLPGIDKERKPTLLVVLVELANREVNGSGVPDPPRGLSETYGELVILGWFDGTVLG